MSQVLVMIPSRDRPRQLDEAVRSVLETSQADVAVYIDDDQQQIYGTADHPRVKQVFGPRVGPGACTNQLVEQFPGYVAYGLMTDDSVMTRGSWDEWVKQQIDQYQDRILAVSPSHNHGSHVDMPFVSREWIDALGWFALPKTIHYAWPSAILLIGLSCGRLIYAPGDSFSIYHEQLSMDRGTVFASDALTLYNFMIERLDECVNRMNMRLGP